VVGKNRFSKGSEGSSPSSPTRRVQGRPSRVPLSFPVSEPHLILAPSDKGGSTVGRWRYTEAALAEAVRVSRSQRQVLANLGLATQGGGAYQTLKRRIALLGLDTSHFKGRGWNAGCRSDRPSPVAIPLETLLTVDSPCTSIARLKRRLRRLGLLEDTCALCGMPPTLNGQPLVLRLDHINGIRNDSRLENLRLVCPNCDSQLPTFAGRNSSKAARSAVAAESRRLTPSAAPVTRSSERARTSPHRAPEGPRP